MTLLQVFLTIIVLFALFVTGKSALRINPHTYLGVGIKTFCAICASVFTTWIIMLALYWSGRAVDKTILATLLGGSAVGIYYLTESKVKEKFYVFRLPFLLTLFTLDILALGWSTQIQSVLILLVALWAIFLLIFAVQTTPRLQHLAKALIECCKKW